MNRASRTSGKSSSSQAVEVLAGLADTLEVACASSRDEPGGKLVSAVTDVHAFVVALEQAVNSLVCLPIGEQRKAQAALHRVVDAVYTPDATCPVIGDRIIALIAEQLKLWSLRDTWQHVFDLGGAEYANGDSDEEDDGTGLASQMMSIFDVDAEEEPAAISTRSTTAQEQAPKPRVVKQRPLPLPIFCDVVTVVLTSPTWAEARGPHLHEQLLPSAVSTMCQWLPLACGSGRRQALISIATAIIACVGEDHAAREMWALLRGMPSDPEADTGRLAVVCKLSATLLRPQSPASTDPLLWRLVLDAVNHTDSAQRKRANHVVRTWQSLLEPGIIVSGSAESPVPFTTSDDARGDDGVALSQELLHRIQVSWSAFIVVAETFEEKQIHIIRPAARKLRALAKESMGTAAVVPLPWIEALFRRLFEHERLNARVLGLITCLSLNFEAASHLLSLSFLYDHLLPCATSVSLYSTATNAASDHHDKAPSPGGLIAPFFSRLLCSPLLAEEDVVRHQRAFVLATQRHCRHVLPFIFLFQTMVSWPKLAATWDTTTVYALRSSVAHNCRAQEISLRNASLMVTLRVLVSNITRPCLTEGQLDVIALVETLSLFTARDAWIVGDDGFMDAARWWGSLFSERLSPAALLVSQFMEKGEALHAPAPTWSQTRGIATALLLTAATVGSDGTDAVFGTLWETLRSLFTRTHMPVACKTRALALFSTVVQVALMGRSGERLGCRVVDTLFQQQRTPSAFATALNERVTAKCAVVADGVVQYVLERWSRDPLAVFADPDAFEMELDALRTLVKAAPTVKAIHTIESTALPWATHKTDADRRVIGLCALACIPTARGPTTAKEESSQRLQERVALLASFQIPKRKLSPEECERVAAATAHSVSSALNVVPPKQQLSQGAASLPWSQLTRLVSQHCWSGLHDVLFDALSVTEVHPVKPYIPYPGTTPPPIRPRLHLDAETIAALLDRTSIALDYTVREDTLEPLSAAALALYLSSPKDVDPHQLQDFVSSVFRAQTAANSHGRVVAPTLPTLHAVNAVVFNPTSRAVAVDAQAVMATIAASLIDLMVLAANVGHEEKRGLMLPTALWINAVVSHQGQDGGGSVGGDGGDLDACVGGVAEVIAKLLVYGPMPAPFHAVVYDTIAYCTAVGLNTLRMPPGVVSPLDSRVVRAITIATLFQLPTGSLGPLYAALVSEDDAICTGVMSFHSNTRDHRTKHRCWQVLVLFAVEAPADLQEQLLERCKRRFTAERHHSVRYLIEWCLMLFIVNGRLPLEELARRPLNPDAKVAHMCSVLTVMWRVVATHTPRDQRWLDMCRFLLHHSLPLVITLHVTARLYSSTCFYSVAKLLEEHASDPTTAADVSSVLEDPFVQRTKDFLEHESDAFKYVQGLRDDFFFSTFDPTEDASLEFLFTEAPVLFGMTPEEGMSSALMQQFVPPSKLGVWDRPLRACVATAVVGLRSKMDVKKMARAVDTTTSGDEEARDSKDLRILFTDEDDTAFDVGADIQKKIDPSALLAAQDEVAFGAEHVAQNQRHAKRQRSKLIVVASLISLPTNLGGLSRTCEIFNVGTLVLAAEKYINMREFRVLSVTSERWQNFEFVHPANLPQWLREMKQNGYTIVGVEQTADSVVLPQVQFPENTVLLLGDEAKGIPADLLTETDMNVEIPQKGVTRSLNVHVSASLVIYKYAEQHIVTAAP